jgi:hypothetical protein
VRKAIILKAGRTQADVEADQCDIFETHDTIKEAKERLAFVKDKGKKERYLFSSMYQAIIEASEPLRYAQILVDGECVQDFFAKGYRGEEQQDEA